MSCLGKDHPEFKMIKQYINSSMSKIYPANNWGVPAASINKGKKTIEQFIVNAFAVERRGEAERIKKWSHLPNRYLLWHASKVSNYLSILCHGLRVGGLGAIKTGSTLGDGIYFADMFSKSWPYS